MGRSRRPLFTPRRRTPRLQGLSFNRIIPNLMTLLALCAGLTAIRLGQQGQFEKAVIAIILAAILDGLDGRVARLLKGTSPFGAELDSLSDFVCFGVAPALILYQWSLTTAGSLGWGLALVYVVCCALRLARFNTQLMGERDLPAWAYNYFTGVPAPAAAGLALLPLILSFETATPVFSHVTVVGAVLTGVSGLMISRLPTYSLKKVRIPHSAVLPLMLGIGVVTGFLVANPWLTLSGLGLAYLLSLPVAAHTFGTLERAARQMAQDRDSAHRDGTPPPPSPPAP